MRTLGLLAALVLFGCGNSAADVCKDVKRAFGDTAERCGFDRAESEAAFVDGATMGMGCSQTDQIRDLDELYDVCIPFIENLTCDEFTTGFTLPSECMDQLLFRL